MLQMADCIDQITRHECYAFKEMLVNEVVRLEPWIEQFLRVLLHASMSGRFYSEHDVIGLLPEVTLCRPPGARMSRETPSDFLAVIWCLFL